MNYRIKKEYKKMVKKFKKFDIELLQTTCDNYVCDNDTDFLILTALKQALREKLKKGR